MNETKLSLYRDFRATLKAVAASLNATAIHTARMDEGVFEITNNADHRVQISVTYTNYEYDGGPRLYLGTGSKQPKLKNLTAANLKKHLTKELAYRQYEINRDAISNKEDSAADKAQKEMVKVLTASLSGSFTFTNADVPTWRGASGIGMIRLFHTKAVVDGKTDQFEFTFRFKYVANVSGARLEGELEARDTVPALRTFKALYSL